MKKHYYILTALLFNSHISFSQQDNWDVYLAQYEKGVGSTVLNMSLKQQAPIKQFPFSLKTGVKLLKCTAEGLPTKEEFDMLYKISDKMKAIVDSVTKNKIAGTFSYQCERLDYYYVADTNNLRQLLEAAYKTNFPQYTYSIKIVPDQNWEAYLTFLYPNEETLEYMSNEKVIMNLQKAGDGLVAPRQVDHWLYFKTEADRNQFITYAVKEKFKIESQKILKEVPLQYQLQISRTDKVDIESISTITIALRKKAKELNGDYDGWETFVVKPK